jgi:gentisate 1,2-dioxygenase
MAAQVQPPVASREDFYGRLRPLSLSPLWEVLGRLVPPQPQSPAACAHWRYNDVRPFLNEAGQLISAEEAERRVLVLENPALAGQSRITSTLYAGLQLVLPGEVAACHRHTQSALRFVMEGSGAFTAVDGEPVHMQQWDLVLTSSMRWHDHGNRTDTPIIWLDGLDIPLVAFFDAGFAEKLEQAPVHAATRPSGDSIATTLIG